MTASSVLEQRTAKIVEAEAAQQLEAERLAERERAAEQLATAQAEMDRHIPALEEAANEARKKWERAKASLKAASEAYDVAGRALDGKRFELSSTQERARAAIVRTADPEWDRFEKWLRDEGAAALANRRDLLGPNKAPLAKPNPVDVDHNTNCRNRWQACMRAIEKVRDRKADPGADAAVEIPTIRDALPSIETA